MRSSVGAGVGGTPRQKRHLCAEGQPSRSCPVRRLFPIGLGHSAQRLKTRAHTRKHQPRHSLRLYGAPPAPGVKSPGARLDRHRLKQKGAAPSHRCTTLSPAVQAACRSTKRSTHGLLVCICAICSNVRQFHYDTLSSSQALVYAQPVKPDHVVTLPPLANSRVSARRSPGWGGETVAK